MSIKFNTKRHLYVYLCICLIITLPFAAASLVGELDNEGAYGLYLPFLAGLPWNLVYLYLPLDIPGLTSAGIPDESGDLTISIWVVLLIFLPVYLNIYLALRLLVGGTKRTEHDTSGWKSDD